MAEPQDWLVQTKLQPPLLHADTIARQRLLDALKSAVSTRPVTLISAPAGYGKTTLLASLPGLLPDLRLAWLALDEEDNDPARCLGGLVAALQRLEPAVGMGARAYLASDPRRVVALIINDVLAHLPGPFALVLDDLHLVTEPRVHAALDFLIERLPAQMRLVIATRHDPPLALARLIARRQVAEVRRPQLGFTPDEARQLLNDTLGLALSPGELDQLSERTEGWAAGLCLLASSLERISTESGRAAVLNGLVQTDGYVFDFLAAEVLRHQEHGIRAFLLETSILAELTPALAEAVTLRSDAGRLLEMLYRHNLFLVRNESGAYRYHALFAEFLRGQLQAEQPELVAELHRRAALAQPSRTRAIGHFLAARRYEEAAGLIEEVGEQLLLMGQADSMHAWGVQIPAPVKEAHPRLCLILSRALISLGDYPGAAALAEHARDGSARAGQIVGEAIALNALASIAMLMGDLAACRAAAARFAELAGLPKPLQARRMAVLAYLHGTEGRWDEAAVAVRQSLALVTESGDLSAAADVMYRFGPWVALLPGCLEPFERFCRWAEAMAPAEQAGLRLVLADRIAMTELLRGRLDSAAAAAQGALAIKERIGGYVWLGVGSTAALATIAMIRGDHEAAAAHADALVHDTVRLPHDQREIWLYVAGRTYWHLGQLEAARRVLTRMQDAGVPKGFHLGPGVQERLTGLLALSDGRLADAARAFRAAVGWEVQSPITLSTGSARVPLVRALMEQQRREEALAELGALEELCAQWGMPGIGLQEGALIAGLVPGVGGEGVGVGSAAARTAAAAAALPEALTDREFDVLRLVAAGATNREIAAALIIGDETAKTHVARILRKLDAPTRVAAAAKARLLGLI